MEKNWYLSANCASVGIEPFYPEKDAGPSAYEDARRVCGRCAVQEYCLSAALREERGNTYVYGMRGGLTPRERRKAMLSGYEDTTIRS